MAGQSLDLRNDLAEIQRLAEAIAQFGALNNLSAKRVNDLQLIMEELVVNAITHGFPQGGEHVIHVDLYFEGGRIITRMVDDGIEFNPLNAAPPDTSSRVPERAIGGLGIHLAKVISDKLEYRREGNRNILRVEIKP